MLINHPKLNKSYPQREQPTKDVEMIEKVKESLSGFPDVRAESVDYGQNIYRVTLKMRGKSAQDAFDRLKVRLPQKCSIVSVIRQDEVKVK